MKTVEMFHAAHSSKRFKPNQKVWVQLNCANHLLIRYKFRGNGRYVSGQIDKHSTCVGEIKAIEVDSDFAARVGLPW